MASPFKQGAVLIGQHPFLLGVLPCVVVGLRVLLLGGIGLVAAVLGFQRALAEAQGVELLSWGAVEWTAAGIVVGALFACEHVITTSLRRVTPRLMRGQGVGFDDYFDPRRLFVGLLVRLVLAATFIIGLSLAGIGVVLCLPWLHALHYAADQDQGPLSACLRSWSATKRSFGSILLFELGALALYFGGLMACGVGVIGAYVVVTASRAACYEIARSALNT